MQVFYSTKSYPKKIYYYPGNLMNKNNKTWRGKGYAQFIINV